MSTPSANASKDQMIWSLAELLRGVYKQHNYQDVILPLVVLKRLDSVLAKTKDRVVNKCEVEKARNLGSPDLLSTVLTSVAGAGFYNCSRFDFNTLLNDPSHLVKNFRSYLRDFSPNVREIFAKFDFDRQLEYLAGGDLLYRLIKELNKVDLSPAAVSNHEMGTIFEGLLRRFSEQSNETAGEHYTPREVIQAMVELLLTPDMVELKDSRKVIMIYDCACGTGGMLSVAKERIKEMNPKAKVYLFGQELNAVTYAMCKADMLIKGDDPDRIRGGDKDHSKASTLSNDQFDDKCFDYLMTNPPFGVEWKKDKEAVEREHETLGFGGRFGAGLPRISDGQLLFMEHIVAKMRPASDGGARLAIVMNGSPLFTGDAGSGESEIRRWLMEKDLVEAIIALPDQLFFNTGISTYVWILTNRKVAARKGRVQLIDARGFFRGMRKSLGNKRHEIGDVERARILELYRSGKDGECSKTFKTTNFAYRQITIERPLRLNFQVSGERLARLKDNAKMANDEVSKKKGAAGDEENREWLEFRKSLYKALESFGDKLYKNRDQFIKDVKAVIARSGATKQSLPTPILKIILSELSERDETADICLGADGKPEADSELRDTENVPWDRDVRDYFEKEILPFATDAWINETICDHKDGKVGKVGYEIPFTRYFYEYVPPRDLAAIEADIQSIEGELLKLLKNI